MKTSSVAVSLKKYSLDAVRYAAYAVSGPVYVLIKPAPGGKVRVEFTPKQKLSPREAAALAGRFRSELADEKLHERIAAGNRELREFLILKALNWQPKPPSQDDSGLTPQQEKELNALIAQIESEIKAEASRGASADPLGITSTWEDKYDSKNGRKKNR